MKVFLKNTKTIAVAVMVIVLIGCKKDDKTENLPEVLSSFTHTTNQATGTVTFINTSEKANKYSWDFGDGTTSTEINPIKTYTDGTYKVKLTAKNYAGASSTSEDDITILIPKIVSLPVTFDDPNTIYKAEVFNGTSFAVVDNPHPSDTNKASKVGEITNSGKAYEGIYFDLGSQIDLTVNQSISMTLWAEAAVDVLLKLEEGTNFVETPVSHGGGGWQTLVFDFTSSDKYSKFTLFVDAAGTTKGKFYIDDIKQIVTVDTTPPVITLKGNATMTVMVDGTFIDPGATATDNVDVDGDVTANIITGGVDAVKTDKAGTYKITYNVSDKAGNAAVEVTRTVTVSAATPPSCEPETKQSLIASDFNLSFMENPSTSITEDDVTLDYSDNPNFTGINKSCKVGKVTNGNVNKWDNIQIDLDEKLKFMSGSNFTMKIYAPQSGYKVTLKLEDKAASGTNKEVSSVKTTKKNEWEELTFSFEATDSDKYDKIVIIFDLETTNKKTYYFDDLKLNAGTPATGGGTTGGCTGTPTPAKAFPVDFEGCDSFTDSFNNDGTITTELATNPNKTGINNSDYVLKVFKASGTNRWAGFQNAFTENFDATKTFKIKVYSSKANVVMKFEINSNPQLPGSGNPGPQYATIENANTWTEVEITFTGIPDTNMGFNQLVVKPDNPADTDGGTTDSDVTYYFDDIRLE